MIIEFNFPTSTVTITEEFGDRVYIEDVIVNVTGESGGGGGVTDHGALTGLADDDHTQYFNQARGDARYYTETEVDTLLSGKADSSHTHIIGDVTGLQTALDGKAATSHTHVIGDVTGLQTALDGKQETLVSGTNIKTINSESLLGSGNIVISGGGGSDGSNDTRELLKLMGSSVLYESYGLSRANITGQQSLTDGIAWFSPVRISAAGTITGVGYVQTIQGNYTGDNNNKVALYTFSGGTYTKVAESANDTELWKSGANTIKRVAFSSPYSAAAGLYYIAVLHNNSAQVTAPSIGIYPTVVNGTAVANDLTSGLRWTGFVSSQTDLAASYSAASLGITPVQFYLFLY